MAEGDERKCVVSDLSIEEDSMQGSLVLILECDNVKTAISDLDLDCEDQEYLVLNPMKENPAAETIWNKEDRVLDPNVLMSLEHSLHEEVIQSVHEQQDENFVQVSKRVSLDEFMVDDSNDSVGFQETFEVSFLMIDECNENLAVISYEDDQNYIQTSSDQIIQDSLSDSSSYVSCFEMFFEEEICSSICSEFFEDHEHTLIYEERPESREKDTLFFQQKVNLHVFQDPLANLLQSAVEVIIVVFSDEGDNGQLCFWMPSYKYLLLTRRSNSENQSRRHLLDWLHWHFDIV